MKDILIACVDGLKGFPEAIEAAYPQTQVQLCIVHLVRHSLNFVSWKQRKEMADDLKVIYSASTVEQAEANLATFRNGMIPILKWGSHGETTGSALPRTLRIHRRYAESSTQPTP